MIDHAMYTFLLGLHNLLRWVVVLGGMVALATSLYGLVAGKPWSRAARVSGLVFSASLGVQLLLGLWLYTISPLVQNALGNMGAAMRDDRLRFFAVEHLTTMILALIAAQAGYSLSKRAATDRAKYVRASAGYVAAALLLAYGIPWWRSLVPWG